MSDRYDGDVALKLTVNGGDITYENGQPDMDVGGLENAVLISLFSGPGWQGNALDENEPSKQVGSNFEKSITAKPITSNSLRTIEEAGESALQWLIDIDAAKSVDVTATAPGLRRVDIIVQVVKPDDVEVEFLYTLNWSASASQPVNNPGV